MIIAATIEGLDTLVNRMNDFNDAFSQEQLTALVLAAADLVIDEARPSLPVAPAGEHVPKGHKPGTLRDKGIGKMKLRNQISPESASAGVGFTKRGWYGIFYELGSVHQSPRPVVVPSFDRRKPEILALVGGFVTQTVNTWKEGGQMGAFRFNRR